MESANIALNRLKEGNERFVRGNRTLLEKLDVAHLKQLAEGQKPFAAVIGCADSRVPVEIIFDQGLGDLFVVRVAGNIAALSQIASLEYAVSVLGVRLVMVLGHSNCGAVRAALDEKRNPSGALSPAIQMLLNRIQPSVESVLAGNKPYQESELIDAVVKANVIHVVDELKRESGILNGKDSQTGVLIQGAVYGLSSGAVTFL